MSQLLMSQSMARAMLNLWLFLAQAVVVVDQLVA
jgi:hypothetical protein